MPVAFVLVALHRCSRSADEQVHQPAHVAQSRFRPRMPGYNRRSVCSAPALRLGLGPVNLVYSFPRLLSLYRATDSLSSYPNCGSRDVSGHAGCIRPSQ